jgi:hypothetical protein
MAEAILSNALEKTVNRATRRPAGRKNLTRRRRLAHKHKMANVTGLDRKLILSICIR